MTIDKSLDNVLDSKLKLAIIRLMVGKNGDFKATGRAIAKMIGFSAVSTHDSLKDLYNQKILNLEIIGRQHIYSLDRGNRTVQKILIPMFKNELSAKKEIVEYLRTQIRSSGLSSKIVSVILYGSLQRHQTHEQSDVDIAVIVSNGKDLTAVENFFAEKVTDSFNRYFRAHLDIYLKAAVEFRLRLKKRLPPVSDLMKSYSVIWGKEPLEV